MTDPFDADELKRVPAILNTEVFAVAGDLSRETMERVKTAIDHDPQLAGEFERSLAITARYGGIVTPRAADEIERECPNYFATVFAARTVN